MDEALTRATQAVQDCLAASFFALNTAELGDRLDRAHALVEQVAALRLALVREADARGLAAAEGAHSTASWLAHRWRLQPGTTTRMVRLAAAAGSTVPSTSAELAAGRVNTEQLAVIAAAVAGLPAEHRAAGEAHLAAQAAIFGPRELGRLGERLLEVVAPGQAESKAAAALALEEERAWRDRALSVADVPGTGQVRVSGWLDREGGAALRAALDPLCAPRTDGDAGPDLRSPGQRRADALAEVCRIALACGQLPDNGGDRPQIVVTVPFEALRDQLMATTLPFGTPPAPDGARRASAGRLPGTAPAPDAVGGDDCSATDRAPARVLPARVRPARVRPARVRPARGGSLDTGSHLTPTAVRRLACDAGILPAVLGGDGQILDVGRQRRLFTGPLRRALVLRDRGCAFPACDRPPRWTDGHHIRHWADGGETNLRNAVLLCGYHHRVIHQGRWEVRISPTDGLPEFLPPATLDPQRHPRRNTYHPRC